MEGPKESGGRQATPVTKRNISPERQGENSIKFTTHPVRLTRTLASKITDNGPAPRNGSLRRR